MPELCDIPQGRGSAHLPRQGWGRGRGAREESTVIAMPFLAPTLSCLLSAPPCVFSTPPLLTRSQALPTSPDSQWAPGPQSPTGWASGPLRGCGPWPTPFAAAGPRIAGLGVTQKQRHVLGETELRSAFPGESCKDTGCPARVLSHGLCAVEAWREACRSAWHSGQELGNHVLGHPVLEWDLESKEVSGVSGSTGIRFRRRVMTLQVS